MPLDESVAYYWASLGLSAFAVFLFLWLVRERRPPSGGSEGADPKAPHPGPLPPGEGGNPP